MDASRSPRLARASKNYMNHSFENAAPVQSQIGTQDVRESVYNNYGPAHYYHPTQTAYAYSRSEGGTTNFADKHLRVKQVEEERKRRFEALKFEQLESRHATIEKAHAHTCQWFLHQAEYLAWKNSHNVAQHHNFLWIKGKPGSGKSTLMKFLFNDASSTVQSGMELSGNFQNLVVAFFFNARGSNLETSPKGAYRSLLFQILDKLPDLRTTLDHLPVMTIASLQAVLEEVVQKLGRRPLTIFIDALDECCEEDIQDMVYSLGDLANIAFESKVPLHICLSSRHYPFIHMKHGVSLTLENHLQHTEDMRNYVESQLSIGGSKNARSIKRKILQKASGVFLWVKLVVKILNRRYRSGRLFELEMYLDSIPSGLEDLFGDILTREGADDPRAQKELALCLQWVLFAYRPLSPTELYFAIMLGTSSKHSPWSDPKNLTEDDIDRFILSCSKGLLEQTNGEFGTVQFIHESVRNFFLSGSSLVNLGSAEDIASFAHTCLADCCLAYINSVRLSEISFVDFDKLPETQSELAVDLRKWVFGALPLLYYSVRYLLRHSDSALARGVPQYDLVNRLDLCKVVRLNNLFADLPSLRYDARRMHLTYLLAVNDLPNLLATCLYSIHDKDSHRGYYDSLLHGAHQSGSSHTLRVLLTPLPFNAPWPTLNQSLSWQAQQDIMMTISIFDNSDSMPSHNTVLCWAIENGHLPVVRCLLRTGRINVNSPSSDGSTPLALAALNGDASMLAELLRFGAKVVVDSSSGPPLYPFKMGKDANKFRYRSPSDAELATSIQTDSPIIPYLPGVPKRRMATPESAYKATDLDLSETKAGVALHSAARGGHDEVVRSLLLVGADVDQIGNKGERALHLAAKNGHEKTIYPLIEAGADLNAMSDQWGTALHVACKNHHERVVKALVRCGANVNAHSEEFGTALHVAARHDHSEILLIMIDAGTNINFQYGINKMTALHEATAKGNIATARILLNSGADFKVGNNANFNAFMIAMVAGHYILVDLMLKLHDNQSGFDTGPSFAQEFSPLENASEASLLFQIVISFVVALDRSTILRLLFRNTTIKSFIDENQHFGTKLLLLAAKRSSTKSYLVMVEAGLCYTSLTAVTCEVIASAADGNCEMMKLLLTAVTDEQDQLFKCIIWDHFTRLRDQDGMGP